MSVNKFQPHVFVIPENRANEQLANGFIYHDQTQLRRVQIMPCADGWTGVLEKFQKEYISHLRNYKNGHVIMLIDFDAEYESRRNRFDKAVPDDLKDRVFVIGAKETPELLKQQLGKSFEEIGLSLAEDCYQATMALWGHDHLKHNEPDRLRLIQAVNAILFVK